MLLLTPTSQKKISQFKNILHNCHNGAKMSVLEYILTTFYFYKMMYGYFIEFKNIHYAI